MSLYIVMKGSTSCGLPLKVFRSYDKAKSYVSKLEVDHWFNMRAPSLDEFWDDYFVEYNTYDNWKSFVINAKGSEGICIEILEEGKVFNEYAKNWSFEQKLDFLCKYMPISIYFVTEIKEEIVE